MNLKNVFKKNKQKASGQVKAIEFRRIVKNKLKAANREFRRGFHIIEQHPRSVSILGSARFKADNVYYKQAESLGRRIATELKYTVVTGGGPGIMQAANKGAYEAGGKSLGFGIKLPQEQSMNPYLTESLNFEYFFSRKTVIFYAAECYIYFPGGFGTMDELFEVLTLMQTGEIGRAPVILVGKDFWGPLMNIIETEMLDEEKTISPEDTKLYQIIDSEDEIIKIIKNAPIRETE